MARTTRRNAPNHIAVIEAILQERGWSVASVAARTASTGDRSRTVSTNTLWRVLRGDTPSWPLQAEIAAALSAADRNETITATQLFGHRPLPAWAAELVGNAMAVAA